MASAGGGISILAGWRNQAGSDTILPRGNTYYLLANDSTKEFAQYLMEHGAEKP